MKILDPRTEEIQKTPKCKMSKSKVIEKISKKKFVIDFDVEKNYFIDEINTGAYFQAEEVKFSMNQEQFGYGNYLGNTTPSWYCSSPYKTAKKPKISPTNMSDFTSMIKCSMLSTGVGGGVQDSPFCRLLNESDQFTIEKYQHLSKNDFDEIIEDLNEKVKEKILVFIDEFF